MHFEARQEVFEGKAINQLLNRLVCLYRLCLLSQWLASDYDLAFFYLHTKCAYNNIADTTEEQLEKAKKKTATIDAIVGHPDRLKDVAKDIVMLCHHDNIGSFR
jgi:hypothetical protein